ncbi:unnamed protein product [Spirodela intermedia]|uniref:Uncharacterized protein n=1 Tax=Spirodela intermedia TaxID=51605 RepID=A0A7I8J5M3_SPIIN|nr:unnamed protein product [Spirodela intermedia]CAA6665065.1 unnamed protein product [Spirodela intermedia]
MESPPSIPNSRHADSSAHHRPLQTPSPAISDSNPSSCNPMQSWLESIARPVPASEPSPPPPSLPLRRHLDAVADSDRPARSLLSFGDGYSAVSAALAGPSSGAGDDPLCRWLYETYQSPDPNLRLFVLSSSPSLPEYTSPASPAPAPPAPSPASSRPPLSLRGGGQGPRRRAAPVPRPRSVGALRHWRRAVAGRASRRPPQPTVRILSPPLEPQIAVKATVRASIAALDLCEFAASWADQRRSFPNYLDQLDRSSNTRPGSSLFKGEEDETRGCEEEMGRSEIEDGDDGGGSGGLSVPLTGELLQPLLRILGHCLLAPANPPEVRDAASVAVRCVYARASRDLIPQAILASRSLIQLDDRARKAASMAMATRVRT